MTFYLKYRPQKLSELDLSSVRETLLKLIESKEIPHAFLFSGSKGTGKTSSARILAKVLNCEENSKKLGEPCNKCQQCLSINSGSNIDVIEMDAASNRGIDDIRNLKEAIKLSPAVARKKVYIIDEVHMLTTEACNALLKTLEEPPAHVVFILATTNPEKLPSTVLSRLTLIQFPQATHEEIIAKLARIGEGEDIKTDTETLALIASMSEGSFRDAVKNFEMIFLRAGDVTSKSATEVIFGLSSLTSDILIKLIVAGNMATVLQKIEKAALEGVNMKRFTDIFVSHLHQIFLSQNGVDEKDSLGLSSDDVSSLLQSVINMRNMAIHSNIPQLGLELAIEEFFKKEGKKKQSQTVVEERDIKLPKITEDKVITVEESMEFEKGWKELLGKLNNQNASVGALLRAAKPLNFDGKTLTLEVYYQFHKERLEASLNRKIVEDVATSIYGNDVRLECSLTEKTISIPAPSENVVLTEPNGIDIIDAAKNIFEN